ncbi:MAG: hypothetical protein WAW52_02070 [Methanothrix sp.]
MKPDPEIDRRVYELAKGYLPSLGIPGVTQTLIEKYLDPLSVNSKPASKEELYRRILWSAQEAGMKSGVIGGSIGGVDKLAPVLYYFNPKEVLDNYAGNWEVVLGQIVKELKPRIHRTLGPKSIWPRYCQTIISAAEFVEQFDSADDFFRWVDFFDQDERSRASLPMLLDHEIEGFGFALSCNFLKELGYVNFPKPDVHLGGIFSALKLCKDGKDQYQLFKAIIRVANHSNVTPYNVDKVFWLIGSGKFYCDPEIGKDGFIGRHKQKFIEFAMSKLFGDK